MTEAVTPFPRIVSADDLDLHELVLVPERLARVIRSALDRASSQAPKADLEALVAQLLACPGYRIDKEPWAGRPHP